VRPLNFTVRFRMRHFPTLLVALLAVSIADSVPAQTKQEFLITINSDGTCDAPGLHVACNKIGPKLRQAGIPADTHIRFGLDRDVKYEVVSAAIESVMNAGLTNVKLGSVNTRATP
jgi:biopolymer transport protein ExbD